MTIFLEPGRTSQSDEDDIIQALFQMYGTRNKRFVEFGCGDGRQNNTINLLKDGWSGVWLDPHKKRINSARERWAKAIADNRLSIVRRYVRPENVNKVVHDPLDFLSIDIDGNDYAVWNSIVARPRVVCIEYDAINGTPFERMHDLGIAKGYNFVAHSASKVNAFFVREEECAQH